MSDTLEAFNRLGLAAPALPLHEDASITITVRCVFGLNRIYPVCNRAKLFAELTRHATLSRWNVRVIERLGFTIVTMNADPNADWRNAE